MSRVHAFVDESKRRGYLFAAVLIEPSDLPVVRSTMRSLLLRGQSSVHLRKEGERRQRIILAAVCRLPARALVVSGPGHDLAAARAACLTTLAEAALARNVLRLTIEQADGDLDADRRTLFNVVGSVSGRRDRVLYEHVRRTGEPALWAADAVAWAAAKGGEWRRRLDPLPVESLQIDR